MTTLTQAQRSLRRAGVLLSGGALLLASASSVLFTPVFETSNWVTPGHWSYEEGRPVALALATTGLSLAVFLMALRRRGPGLLRGLAVVLGLINAVTAVVALASPSEIVCAGDYPCPATLGDYGAVRYLCLGLALSAPLAYVGSRLARDARTG